MIIPILEPDLNLIESYFRRLDVADPIPQERFSRILTLLIESLREELTKIGSVRCDDVGPIDADFSFSQFSDPGRFFSVVGDPVFIVDHNALDLITLALKKVDERILILIDAGIYFAVDGSKHFVCMDNNFDLASIPEDQIGGDRMGALEEYYIRSQ